VFGLWLDLRRTGGVGSGTPRRLLVAGRNYLDYFDHIFRWPVVFCHASAEPHFRVPVGLLPLPNLAEGDVTIGR